DLLLAREGALSVRLRLRLLLRGRRLREQRHAGAGGGGLALGRRLDVAALWGRSVSRRAARIRTEREEGPRDRSTRQQVVNGTERAMCVGACGGRKDG